MSAVTFTSIWWACVPTRISARPTRNAGLDKSTSAVGAWYSLPSYQKDVHHSRGALKPQVKKLYHGTSRRRPRRASTLTYTLGPQSGCTFRLTVGSWPLSCTTCVSMMPSRSTATRAVAKRNGMRTWNLAVSPIW